MREAAYYRRSGDAGNTAECRLCPHCCKIPDGKTGICGVRRNQGGVLTAESYGKITSAALDPIEKKPLHHFYPKSKILSVGSYGCNMRCGFCQNHSISMRKAPCRQFSPEDIAVSSKELIPQGNIGVAYTYNEPLIGYEFVRDCASLIKEQGQKNVLVTNGFISQEPFKNLLPFIDAANIDLKSFNPSFYRENGGNFADVRLAVETAAMYCHIEITTLIIPDKNDSEEEMDSLSEWIAGVGKNIPLHISRFFPAYKLTDVPPAPVKVIYRLVEIARRHLEYVYPGNC